MSHASRIASVAASLTCGLVSHMSPLRTGMTCAGGGGSQGRRWRERERQWGAAEAAAASAGWRREGLEARSGRCQAEACRQGEGEGGGGWMG